MKFLQKVLLSLTAVVAMSAAGPVTNTYRMSGDYTVTISGTSNLHKWDETVHTVTGDGLITWNTNGTYDLGKVNLVLVAHSIKSTEGRIMNNNTYKALKADDYPNITFALIFPVTSIQDDGKPHQITAKADLTIAGKTRRVDMTVAATTQGHATIIFEGSRKIKMTDFDIDPPVALFGTLKTGDDIVIHFKTSFNASK